MEKACEHVSNEAEYLLCRTQKHLNSDYTASFSILSVLAGQSKYIGSVSSAGVSASFPASSLQSVLPVITFSFNNGTVDPAGVEHGTLERGNYHGVQLFLAHIQRTRVILPYAQLRLFNLSLGLYTFDETWARA